MATQDRADEIHVQLFNERKEKLRSEFELYNLPPLLWEFLEDMLGGIELMTAYYSCNLGVSIIHLSTIEKQDFYLFNAELIHYYLGYFLRKYMNVELNYYRFNNKEGDLDFDEVSFEIESVDAMYWGDELLE